MSNNLQKLTKNKLHFIEKNKYLPDYQHLSFGIDNSLNKIRLKFKTKKSIFPQFTLFSLYFLVFTSQFCDVTRSLYSVKLRSFIFMKLRSINYKVTNKKYQVRNPYNKLIFCVSLPNSKIYEFFQIWPLSQWISSLIGLILLYALTTYIYNKRLIPYKNEMSLSFRFWMIFSDLAINLAFGLYYLDYRETIMGQLMLKCPIAISPVIFLIELVLVILIKEYEIILSMKNIKKKKKA